MKRVAAHSEPPMAPLLTPSVVRRLCAKSQMAVAVRAGCGVATVRIFEIDERAVRDPLKRRELARVYREMRDQLVQPPPPT